MKKLSRNKNKKSKSKQKIKLKCKKLKILWNLFKAIAKIPVLKRWKLKKKILKMMMIMANNIIRKCLDLKWIDFKIKSENYEN